MTDSVFVLFAAWLPSAPPEMALPKPIRLLNVALVAAALGTPGPETNIALFMGDELAAVALG